MTLPSAIKASFKRRGSVSPRRKGLAPVAGWLRSSAAASPSAPPANNFPRRFAAPRARSLTLSLKIAVRGRGAALRLPAPSAWLRVALPAHGDRPSQRGEAPNDGEKDDPALRTDPDRPYRQPQGSRPEPDDLGGLGRQLQTRRRMGEPGQLDRTHGLRPARQDEGLGARHPAGRRPRVHPLDALADELGSPASPR